MQLQSDVLCCNESERKGRWRPLSVRRSAKTIRIYSKAGKGRIKTSSLLPRRGDFELTLKWDRMAGSIK